MVINGQFVSSINIEFNSPEEVNQDEEFKVFLSLDSDTEHDVKIFVYDDNKEFSEIYENDKFRSPFNYLKKAFPTNKEFKIISHFVGESEICIRVKESNSSNSKYSEKCNPILVLENGNNEEISEKEEEKKEKKIEPKTQPKQEEIMANEVISESTKEIEENKLKIDGLSPTNQEGVIILSNTKSNFSTEQTIIRTKKEKITLSLAISFTIFSLIIVILLSLKKL